MSRNDSHPSVALVVADEFSAVPALPASTRALIASFREQFGPLTQIWAAAGVADVAGGGAW